MDFQEITRNLHGVEIEYLVVIGTLRSDYKYHVSTTWGELAFYVGFSQIFKLICLLDSCKKFKRRAYIDYFLNSRYFCGKLHEGDFEFYGHELARTEVTSVNSIG